MKQIQQGGKNANQSPGEGTTRVSRNTKKRETFEIGQKGGECTARAGKKRQKNGSAKAPGEKPPSPVKKKKKDVGANTSELEGVLPGGRR